MTLLGNCCSEPNCECPSAQSPCFQVGKEHLVSFRPFLNRYKAGMVSKVVMSNHPLEVGFISSTIVMSPYWTGSRV